MRSSLTIAALIAALALSGCDSAEERAQKYFESGMAYLQAGDVDRALVEFRNVFKLNGRHREARVAYADTERKRGNLREAYSQYLLLNEQFPDDPAVLRPLAEIATEIAAWDEADRFAANGLAKAPDDPHLIAARIVAAYGRAAEKDDAPAMTAAADRARGILGKAPDSAMLRRILIDDALRARNFDLALAQISSALAISPDDPSLYGARLSVYAAQGDADAVETQLREMASRFPEQPEMADALVRWYISRGELDKAEAQLRAQIAVNGGVDQTLALVRFLAVQRSDDAAIAELDAAVAAGGAQAAIYRAARAGFMFDKGRTEDAIREMEALIKEGGQADDIQKIKVGLAQMRVATGNEVAARALVEEVLSEDSGDVEAIKLKAGWLIRDDQIGDAINILREAVDQNPRDAQLLTLSAQAFERDGNQDLMREMLAQAVDASGRAPDESLRYAPLLMRDDKALAAEGVLLESLRLNPGSVPILSALGEVYVSIKDWGRLGAVADELDRIATEESRTAAAGLRAAGFEGQQRTEQTIGYLKGLAAEGQGGLATKIAIIRTHLANNQQDKARAYADELLAASPDDPSLRFIDASLRAVTGDAAGAEAGYRRLIEEDRSRSQVWLALYRLLDDQPDRRAEAAAALDQALAVSPDDEGLLWAKAGRLERAGDFDGTIAIYERLYAANSGNPVVANNLASTLATYRDDPESLRRAEVIARRLRDSRIPAYQDTYGWIAYRSGNYKDASTELAKAAEGLPEDPQVQYHFGMALYSLGDKPAALGRLLRALELAGTSDTLPFLAQTRQLVDSLKAEGVTPAP